MAERFKTPEVAIHLGSRLRKARKLAELTLVSVFEETGVNPGQISRIERGEMVTISPNVQKLCTFLKVEPRDSKVPSTRAGRKIDALLAASPISEKAVVRLIAAIEDVVLEISGDRP